MRRRALRLHQSLEDGPSSGKDSPEERNAGPKSSKDAKLARKQALIQSQARSRPQVPKRQWSCPFQSLKHHPKQKPPKLSLSLSPNAIAPIQSTTATTNPHSPLRS